MGLDHRFGQTRVSGTMIKGLNIIAESGKNGRMDTYHQIID
jgi:hypothetical protein